MPRPCLLTYSLATLILSAVIAGCGNPDISDQDVHRSGITHIDTIAFNSGAYHFPDSSWILYERPEALGWNKNILTDIGNYADSLDTAALMIVHKGALIYDWGATNQKYITQSIRKGLLNSLYGIYWQNCALQTRPL